MHKKLLPALMSVALAGGMSAANADVMLTGFIDTSLDSTEQDGGGRDINLNCNTCAIGVKGSEDLGNGLKAIFKLDFQYDATERNQAKGTSGTNALTDRDQWLGLAGNFGKVRIGTISTVYKSHGAKLDPMYRTGLQGRDRGLQSRFHAGAGEEDDGRSINTVRWDSKNFSGLKVGATYQFDEGDTSTDNDDAFGVGASYSIGESGMVFADYIDDQEDAGSNDGEDSAWKVGGKVDWSIFTFMGQYEEFTRDGVDGSAYFGGVLVNNLLTMNIYLGIGGTENDLTGDDANAWTLAVYHDLSKQTRLYLGHSQYDCDAGDPDGAGPLSASLSICNSVGPAGGEDDKTAVFGIRHRF